MTLSPGEKLGSFEIARLIGRGGMGQVYRARDLRLGRDVAIKVLPPGMANESERLKRFEREARALASMNHPHIAHIFGLEADGDTHFLVMELAEGPTLKDVLIRGKLKLRGVLEIFEQIARALESAHERGIIHRDLKPANIVVTDEHGVKILDFGLAKAFEPQPLGSTDGTLSMEDPSGQTREGQILGTPAYMSPEQAQGKPVDKRIDIWAFGCCLYEALIGHRPFSGDTGTEVMASILKDAPDLDELPREVPWRIRELIELCLEKDPRLRLRDIGDAWSTIQRVLKDPEEGEAGAPHGGNRVRSIPMIMAMAGLLAGLVLAGTLGFLRSNQDVSSESKVASTAVASETPKLPARHLSLALHPDYPWAEWDGYPLTISPDGEWIAYCTFPRGKGERELYLHAVGGQESRLVQGTRGAMNPFFSPDGRWIAFTARGKLMKVAVEGAGLPVALADAPICFWGGHWGEDGYLYYVPFSGAGIYRVPENGGGAERITTPNYAAGERGHADPFLLPGGKTLLISVPNFEEIESRIYAYSLEAKTMKPIVEGTRPMLLPNGYLLLSASDTLRAVRFDPETLEIDGSPTPLLGGVQIAWSGRGAKFACSRTGTLAYVADPNPEGQLHWVDMAGRKELLDLSSSRSMKSLPTLSPSGELLASFDFLSPGDLEAWIADLKRGTVSRASFEGASVAPVWSPDSQRLYYAQIDKMQIRSYSVVKGEPDDFVLQMASLGTPYSVSPDGRYLAMGIYHPFSTSWNIYLDDLQDKAEPKAFVSTAALESLAVFSPDGNWIAYNSDETGRFEVYVRAVNGEGVKVQISGDGGNSPQWAPDGTAIYYRSGARMMKANLAGGEGVEVTGTESLFELHFESGSAFGPNYSIAPGGDRFLIPASDREPLPHHRVELIENWFEEIERIAGP